MIQAERSREGVAMMHDYAGGWQWGMGFGHWALGLLFWVAVILVIAALFKYLFFGSKGS